MGTRADFYVGRGATAEWIGSIAWDGYPSGITPKSDERTKLPPLLGGGWEHKRVDWPEGAHLFDATTESDYRERVTRFFQYRDDVTLPARGWPWPWEDSRTTDYAYAFDGGTVWASCFGYAWFDPKQDDPELPEDAPKVAVFPQFSKERMAEPGDQRSGMMMISIPR